jgi:hypothetical protein
MRKRKKKMFTTGDSFFDGPEMQAAKGPLIGGGLTQLGTIAIRKFVPSMAKHAPLIGMVIGGGVSAYLMTKPQHKEAGAAGLATALIIGLPQLLDEYMGTGLLKGDEVGDDQMGDEMLGAYAQEMGAGEGLQLLGPAEGVQIQDSGSGSTGLIGAVTQEMGAITSDMGAPAEGLTIQGSDFGATGF